MTIKHIDRANAIITGLASIAYTVACICLYVISLWIIIAAVWRVFEYVETGGFTVYKLLDEVGLIVFSIAVIDVSKYLMVEEVLKGGDRSPTQARRTFTRFIVIIVTALSLEGLVLTIEMAKTDITKIVYPICLFITATILMIGISVYQRLNAISESGKS